MKRLISIILTLLLLNSSFAIAEKLTTNGGVVLDSADLPYCTPDSDASVYIVVGDKCVSALSGAGRIWPCV